MADHRSDDGMETPVNKRQRGKEAEDLACNHLTDMGILILCRNYRTRYGEIDIIGMDRSALVFYEVKSTNTDRFLSAPIEAVTSRKAAVIRKVARAYTAINGLGEQECRFDVVSIRDSAGSSPKISLVEDAF